MTDARRKAEEALAHLDEWWPKHGRGAHRYPEEIAVVAALRALLAEPARETGRGEPCALLRTPTPGRDMTQVLFPGSKPAPATDAVAEAAERVRSVLYWYDRRIHPPLNATEREAVPAMKELLAALDARRRG